MIAQESRGEYYLLILSLYSLRWQSLETVDGTGTRTQGQQQLPPIRELFVNATELNIIIIAILQFQSRKILTKEILTLYVL